MQKRHRLLRLRKRARGGGGGGGGGAGRDHDLFCGLIGPVRVKLLPSSWTGLQVAIANLGGPVIHQLNDINIFG